MKVGKTTVGITHENTGKVWACTDMREHLSNTELRNHGRRKNETPKIRSFDCVQRSMEGFGL